MLLVRRLKLAEGGRKTQFSKELRGAHFKREINWTDGKIKCSSLGMLFPLLSSFFHQKYDSCLLNENKKTLPGHMGSIKLTKLKVPPVASPTSQCQTFSFTSIRDNFILKENAWRETDNWVAHDPLFFFFMTNSKASPETKSFSHKSQRRTFPLISPRTQISYYTGGWKSSSSCTIVFSLTARKSC